MAGTPMATQTPTTAGLAPTYNAAALQNSIANSGRTFVLVKNGSASSINATFVTFVTVGGNAVADKVVAVPAGAERIIGPFDPGVYNDVDGTMQLDISAITSVTIGVFQIA